MASEEEEYWICLYCFVYSKPAFVITDAFIGWSAFCGKCGREIVPEKFLICDDDMENL